MNAGGRRQLRECRCMRAQIAPSSSNFSASWFSGGSVPGSHSNSTVWRVTGPISTSTTSRPSGARNTAGVSSPSSRRSACSQASSDATAPGS